ncbi:hypothetical protein [Halodesulfovibrio sp. MK-HDV]|uniref:hypothetical protein n=1 Tax=Halodesulfovibrio sp. MK-HDV TaxID=2599925 RepID=UPI00136E82FB|nr:hypothetical protein [Halodesulfovibrio sp. MK-HDV]
MNVETDVCSDASGLAQQLPLVFPFVKCLTPSFFKKITTKLFIGAERAAKVDEKNVSTSTDASDDVLK